MAQTGNKALDHSPEVVAQWLNEIRDDLDWADKDGRAYLLLRTVLHTVRDWLSVDEAADLAAQLPVLLRGIYYEGWNPSATPVYPRGKDEFVDRVRNAFSNDPLDDPERGITAVLKLLDNQATNGEIRQVRNSMRKQIRELWP